MKRMRVMLVAGALVLILAAGGASAQSAGQSDAAALQAVLAAYASALNAGDVTAWGDLWAESGVRMSSGERAIVGKAAILAAMTPRLRNFETSLALTCDDVKVAGDFAFVRGCYVMKAKTKMIREEHVPRLYVNPNLPTVSEGTFLWVFQRQQDGTWKLQHESIMEI